MLSRLLLLVSLHVTPFVQALVPSNGRVNIKRSGIFDGATATVSAPDDAPAATGVSKYVPISSVAGRTD